MNAKEPSGSFAFAAQRHNTLHRSFDAERQIFTRMKKEMRVRNRVLENPLYRVGMKEKIHM